MSARPSSERLQKILATGLERLKRQNPRLSIRAVAAKLELSPSYLSKVFRGERPLPYRMVAPLAKMLQLDHHEIAEVQKLLLAGVEAKELAAKTGIQTVETQTASQVADYEALDKKDFWLLESWHHIAILNLLTIEGAEDNPEWIAARLGISADQARDSLAHSFAVGYLKREKNGRAVRTRMKLRFPTAKSHAAVRGYHIAMIKRAAQVLAKPASDEDFAARLLSGVSFAGDPARIPKAKLILERAMFEAAEALAGGSCSEVYQINLQMFPVSKRR